jgi:hypothetical protein
LKPAFNAACDETLLRCLDIANTRGDEYADSWTLDAPTVFQDLVLRQVGLRDLSAEEKRLFRIACLCDTKLSRLGGPFKADTLDDLLTYCGALRSWLSQYMETSRPSALVFVTKSGEIQESRVAR